MAFTSSTPLNKLNSSKVQWVIQVRAQAVWKGITRETKEFRGINLLLINDSNIRIHAFINARISAPFEPKLEEGQPYRISNFTVQRYTGYEGHRCVRNEHHVYFSDYTNMQKITSSVPRVPDLSFDVFDLWSLDHTKDEKRYLFDVVGILMNREPLHKYINEDQQDKIQLKLSICDGRSMHKVTFYDDFAVRSDKALDKQCGGPVVLIIASAKIGHYQGELTISNYPATRLYINVDHYIVRSLNISASNPSFGKDLLGVDNRDEGVVMSVGLIKELKEEFSERRVYCSVKIEKVEDLQWFYHCCPNCSEELVAVDGRFKCTKYNRFIPFHERRFRLSTVCSDNSGIIFIVLGDSEVRQIVKKNVFEVDLEHSKGSGQSKLPLILEQIVGKSYIITLRLSMDNVTQKSDVYESVDIVGAIDSLTEKVPSEDTFTANGETREISVSEVGLMIDEDPLVCSSKPSTKEKTRKKLSEGTTTLSDTDDDFVLQELIPNARIKKSKRLNLVK